ncbi:uncharacterized protein LOC110024099 isoform X2 [Phalaenopsis equestris]|uniref:uncharacterized protein LOC110024099 isoform X2 n=1 Tax=Phalaenopsis equestris TaxID=78828 RepID=UPI0009E4D98B|nr:uncharacterized protein LOC110024099 isoform X2 [Phalaenopsis equestris]
MAAAIGWYGPLIDLSRASSHVGDMVQLLVFVQRSQPIEKIIASSRRPILMTNIQVGDDTMPYFVVSVWHKYIGTMIVPGVVILLQNVKIVKFREVLQATTLQISSLTVLAHGSHLITSKDSDQLIAHLQLGGTTREKYSKVIHWIQHTESAMYFVRKTDGDQSSVQVPKNWKSPEDPKPRNILSITDVLCLHNSCKVVFHAFIGEIFLSSLRNDEAKEQMFLRKTLLKIDKTRIMEDLICLGCTKCGSPMDYRFPLYCSNNSNYVHDIGQIYKPFMLHVWDHAALIPLLVKDRAATILFGSITAEMVHKCYNQISINHIPVPLHYQDFCSSNLISFAGDESRKPLRNLNDANGGSNKPKFYHIWLVLLKILLKKQESPFQFEVNVDKEKDIENGRFELILFRMPCFISEIT